ncbi:MAG: DEAD/DEAH box helicase family protein [Nitrososphaerales archaeon]
MEPTLLSYDRGTIVIRGDVRVPYSSWDGRVRAFRAPALYYREIAEFVARSGISGVGDTVQDLPPHPARMRCRTVAMRGYQQRALESWERAGRRGVIVLPTGAGKTVIALKAIELVNEPAVVVVPTLDLLEQWRRRVEEELGIEAGAYGGGENTVKAVTLCTYDSAYIRAAELGNRFSLIVFDEAHHLPGESFRQIAEMFTAPYRLGLTATYEREDMLHEELPRLVGGVVYRLRPEDLAGRYLSDFRLEKVSVDLTPDEKAEHDRNYGAFTSYLEETSTRLDSPDAFRRFIMRTATDPAARRALLARNRALSIAFNSEAKLDRLEGILRTSSDDDRTIVFTEHNDLVYRISRRFLLPFITHATGKEEREEVLRGFREGKYRAVVTSKVLDEGIDVPEASVGVIVSGTGSSREFVQRLGRLLRKSEGKGQARLIELVSRGTAETRTSSRRKRARTEAAGGAEGGARDVDGAAGDDGEGTTAA